MQSCPRGVQGKIGLQARRLGHHGLRNMRERGHRGRGRDSNPRLAAYGGEASTITFVLDGKLRRLYARLDVEEGRFVL